MARFKWKEIPGVGLVGQRQASMVEWDGRVMEWIRKGQKKSQHTLAQEAGLSEGYVGELERGEKNPTTEVMAALGNALRVIFYK